MIPERTWASFLVWHDAFKQWNQNFQSRTKKKRSQYPIYQNLTSKAGWIHLWNDSKNKVFKTKTGMGRHVCFVPRVLSHVNCRVLCGLCRPGLCGFLTISVRGAYAAERKPAFHLTGFPLIIYKFIVWQAFLLIYLLKMSSVSGNVQKHFWWLNVFPFPEVMTFSSDLSYFKPKLLCFFHILIFFTDISLKWKAEWATSESKWPINHKSRCSVKSREGSISWSDNRTSVVVTTNTLQHSSPNLHMLFTNTWLIFFLYYHSTRLDTLLTSRENQRDLQRFAENSISNGRNYHNVDPLTQWGVDVKRFLSCSLAYC